MELKSYTIKLLKLSLTPMASRTTLCVIPLLTSGLSGLFAGNDDFLTVLLELWSNLVKNNGVIKRVEFLKKSV